MANMTLSIPEEIRREMDEFPEINWSEIARGAIKKRILLLKEMNKLLSKSKITEEDTIRLGREVNKKLAKRLLKNGACS